MSLKTAKQWAREGFRIRTGCRSDFRGAGGVPLFSHRQVTPWDYVPVHFNTPQYITVDGQLIIER